MTNAIVIMNITILVIDINFYIKNHQKYFWPSTVMLWNLYQKNLESYILLWWDCHSLYKHFVSIQEHLHYYPLCTKLSDTEEFVAYRNSDTKGTLWDNILVNVSYFDRTDLATGACLDIKMPSYQYMCYHYKNKTVSRVIFIMEILCTERPSFYWDGAW